MIANVYKWDVFALNLVEALLKVDDDDRVMLKVYDDIQEELKAKTTLVKKAKRKVSFG